jgi:hypothetical protein
LHASTLQQQNVEMQQQFSKKQHIADIVVVLQQPCFWETPGGRSGECLINNFNYSQL